MSLLRSDRSIAGLVLVTGLLASACVGQDDPGVDVQSLQADIVFGVELAAEEKPVVPPSADIPEQQAPSQAPPISDGTLRIPFRNPAADRLPTFDVEPPTGDCPAAPIGASPSEAAPEEVTSLPRKGLYRWQREVTISRDVGGVVQSTPFAGAESRLIDNVRELGAGTDPRAEDPGKQYAYDVYRPGLFGETVLENWFVNTSPVDAGVNSPGSIDPGGTSEGAEGIAGQQGIPLDLPDEVQQALPNGNRVRTGEPNRGLIFQGEEYLDGNGEVIGQFNPSPPLLYLPLDVQVGDFWTSTGVDPRTGETRRIDGVVAERRSVDACGTLLDGWLVEIDETRAAAGVTATRSSELVISTTYGAVVIGEDYTETSGPVKVEASFRVGQKDPSPIPEELRQ